MKPEEYFEKRIIPEGLRLMYAVIQAREASKKAQKNFDEELARYLEKCQKEKSQPKAQWLDLLKWLSHGKKMMDILEALQISPTSVAFLELLEFLKAHGFPDKFIDGLISEIPPDILDNRTKDILRQRIPLYIEK